jgi:polysaccharide export outer membrane protein
MDANTLNSHLIRRLAAPLLLTLLSTLLIAGVAVAEKPAADRAAAQPAVPADDSYLLQPGDVVEISVWNEENLSKQLLVRPDGGLSFPLAGDLKVAGLAPADVQRELELRLTKFFSDATVTVSVLQINGNQVYVVGKVNRPGAYKFDRAVDVMQALSLAGGTTEFAGVDDIRVIRRDTSGRQRVFAFAYSDVARGRNLEQNILLQSGDTLVVP